MAFTLGGSYITNNLQCYLDSNNPLSYSGTGTTWADLSGNGMNGTLVNGPTFNNGAIVFNGINQYVTCGNFGTFYSQGTISFLMNASALESYRNPFTTNFTNGAGSNVGIRFEETYAQSGTIGVVIGNDAGTYNGWYIRDAGLEENRWYYITVSWNTSTNTVTGYINGVQSFTTSSHTYWPTQMPNVVLGNGFGSTRYFAGSISNFSIYNRQLSNAEILQNYSALGISFSDNSTQLSKFDTTTDMGKLLSISSYTTAGSYTWTKPAGCTKVIVKLVGGGGGGSGYCESGGAGGYSEKTIDVANVSSVSVTVGAGGALAAYSGTGGLGTTGGTSSFGSYCTATGGHGSNRNANHTGGYGGLGSSGDINLYGGSGTGHGNSLGHGQIGKGGDSYFGGCNGVGRHSADAGARGIPAPGAGGTGGLTDTGAAGHSGTIGCNGVDGAVFIWNYS